MTGMKLPNELKEVNVGSVERYLKNAGLNFTQEDWQALTRRFNPLTLSDATAAFCEYFSLQPPARAAVFTSAYKDIV